MVRILTKDYTELDLTKGYEFQIEMENPMLDEEHLPSAFSTQISFPPSEVNRKVFGYTPAMFLAPNVKKLEASVWIGGVPFVSGTLVYDGIEDGCLLYTFTEKVAELDGKIWEKSLLEFSTRRLPEPSENTFSTPLLINKNQVAVQPYSKASRIPVSGEPGGPGSTTGQLSEDDYLYRQKYFNYVNDSETFSYKTFVPAVPLRVILQGCPVSVPEGLLLRNGWAEISILGRYHEVLFDDVVKPDSQRGIASSTLSPGDRKVSTGKPVRVSSSGGVVKTDLASFLPDISFSDLLTGLCSMFCSTVFNDGGTLRVMENGDVIGASGLDWDGKISDDFSSEEEAAMSYRFGFGDNGNTTDSEKLAKGLEDGSVVKTSEGGVTGILDLFTSEDDYTVVFDEGIGNVYSGRQYTGVVRRYYDSSKNGAIVPVVTTCYECDVLYQGAKPVENKVDDADTFDNSTEFIVPYCTPEKVIKSDDSFPIRMSAVIEPNAEGEERDDKVYIGVSYEDQFFTDGVFTPLTKTDAMFVGTEDITPGGLWDKYHKAFAEWIGKTRQRVAVDVNLSPVELHNFRLYRPVYFKGRKWVVAKLSVTVAAGSEAVSVRGEFIEI